MRKPSKLLREALPEIIGGLVVLAVQAVISELRGGVSIWNLVFVVVACLWLGCVYVIRKKTPPLVEGGEGQPAFPRWRRLALRGFVAIPLLTAVTLGSWWYYINQPPDKVIITVAEIDGPDPKKYRVTEIILKNLRDALADEPKAQVKCLAQAITEIQGGGEARRQGANPIGTRNDATLAIWGWYGVTEEAVQVTLYFEILREPLKPQQIRVERGPVEIAQLNSFKLQTELSTEMSYLTTFTVGMVHYISGHWERAKHNFTIALAQPKTPLETLSRSIAYFYRGNTNSALGDHQAAIADFTEAIEQKLCCLAEAYNNRGGVYYCKGEYDLAIADYNRAIELKPDYTKAYNNRGNVYTQKGEYDLAIADYDKAIELKPDDAQAYNSRGVAHYYKGEYDLAITDYDRAIELKPDDACAYNNRGLAYDDKGEHELAITDYDRAIELKPEYADAYYNRGLAHAHKGEYDQAITDSTKAIELKPDYAEAYTNRGSAYDCKGEYDLAIADFDRAIELKPDLAEAYCARGLAYDNKGEYELAIADHGKAIRLNPDFALAYYNRGTAYLHKCEYDEAIADFNRAIELKPDDADAYYNRGFAHKMKGKKDEAIRDFEQVLELSEDEHWREKAEKQLKELRGQ